MGDDYLKRFKEKKPLGKDRILVGAPHREA
jgi:hypothetical protein